MAVLSLIRTIVFATTCLFSLIIIGVGGHAISFSTQYFGLYFNFAALGVAIAVLNLVTLPAFFVIDLMRVGAFTSMIVVELSWLFVLMVLWLATAADASSTIGAADCSLFLGIYRTPCQEMQALEAFAFLNWLLVLGYAGTVLVFAVKAASNGHQPWKSSVKELTWSGDGDGSAEMRGISHSGHPAGGLQAAHQPNPV